MENNIEKMHRAGLTHPDAASKSKYQKTISELERRNAHLHAKPRLLKNARKKGSV